MKHLLAAILAASVAHAADRPNILWITCEDISPNVGCFGDAYAVTPNIDKLATQGVRYNRAFAPIGVCAPSRSTLILGVFACSAGTHHMRCKGNPGPDLKCFPEYLRTAGYHCTNNVKEDYNFQTKTAWNESSNKAHWRSRKGGQPFFAVFNFTTCHESQIRLPEAQYRARVKDFTPAELHDPAKATVPPYHPDTPEVRRDWARYADMITFMDKQVGALLAELEKDGLAEDTIVFWFSDHGAGMPRSKRWLYDSSLRVPMIVRFPQKWKHLSPDAGKPGATTDRLVSFVDFGPTVLNLCSVPVPPHMQGKPFLGAETAEPRRYVHGFRDRMDDRIDMLRCVRDDKFKYIRNYMPHVTWAQHISYMYQMPTMKVWHKLHDEGKLTGAQKTFFSPVKPMEELYDTQADPWEINNLAEDPNYAGDLKRLRAECRRWMLEIRDLGLLPEAELRTRFDGKPEHAAVRADPAKYPIEKLMDAADLANRMDAHALPGLVGAMADPDPAVRWWGVIGCRALGEKAAAAEAALIRASRDKTALVRVAAADALARMGNTEVALPVLIAGLSDANEWVRLAAGIALDDLGAPAAAKAALRAARTDKNEYVKRVVEHALSPKGD